MAVYARAAGTAEGPLPVTPRPLPFRTLASVADITAGDQEQLLRILRDLTDQDPVGSLDEVRPRLDCAQAWVAGYMDPADRTQVRPEPDPDGLAALSEEERRALKLLTERMGDCWSLTGLTTLLYGIPKLLRGLPLDAPRDPGAEGRPAGLVHPALPAADREGHRPAAAHAAAGAGPGPDPLPARDRVTADGSDRGAQIGLIAEAVPRSPGPAAGACAAGELRVDVLTCAGRPRLRADRGPRCHCDPDDGWYPDTSELDDLLDEVEDLAGQAPDVARELAGHAAARIREVLAAGNCLTGDLADTLARAQELAGYTRLIPQGRSSVVRCPEPAPGVPGVPPPAAAGPRAG